MIKLDVRKSEKTNEDYGLFVSFPYDANIIDIIRGQLIKYWNPENKEWELPLSSLNNLINAFSAYEIEVNVESADILFPKKAEIPANFQYKTKPFAHQEIGVQYGMEHNKWLLGDEQGLGKTKEVIDIAVAKKLQNGYKHCLIICCVNGLKWNWANEVATHSNETAYILGQREKGGKLVVEGNAAKLEDLQNLPDAYFLITNIESLRNEQILNRLVELCKANEINMIAADEVHMAKNPASQQGKAFLKLHTPTMIAMSGTPLMNSPLDLYVILKWLGVETHSFYSFKNHYCEMGGYGDYEVIGYKNLAELQAKLENVMLRRKKDDVLDLPEKTYIAEYVDMTPKQLQIYKEVASEIQANIDKIKASNNPLAELIRMRQATGYTGILSSKIMESAKLDRMEELVAESVANNKQVVIFSNWTQMTDVIVNRLAGKYTVGLITGQTTAEDRIQAVETFQRGITQVMVGTIGAMGTGLTLTAGTVEIFLDEPWNKAKKEQAEDRCHRVGTTENVTIYTLLCKNTIDERINELVEKKGRMANALVDGKFNGDKGQLVDYLLS